MPRMDNTGPSGAGPMTGGGRGMCVTDEPGRIRRFLGRGMGLGRGLGRGRGRGAGMRGGRGGWMR